MRSALPLIINKKSRSGVLALSSKLSAVQNGGNGERQRAPLSQLLTGGAPLPPAPKRRQVGQLQL